VLGQGLKGHRLLAVSLNGMTGFWSHHSRAASRMTLAVCAAMAVGCGHSSPAPTSPSSSAPSGAADNLIARLSVTIDSLGSSVALPTLSQVLFDASASGGPGTLHSLIDFGDGASTAGPTSHHVYQSPGTYQASVTVTDSAGRKTSTSQTVVVRAVQGTWMSAVFNVATARVEVRRLTITSQTGFSVKGQFDQNGGESRAVTGTLSGERTLTLSVPAEPPITGAIPSQVFDGQAILSLTGFAATAGPLSFSAVDGDPSSPPPVARLDLDTHGSNTAIIRYTPVGYSASRSTGDGLSYFIEFGDGTFTTDPSAAHACQRWTLGLATAVSGKLTVVDRFGRVGFAQSRKFTCVGLVHYDQPSYSLTYGWTSEVHIPGAPLFDLEGRALAFESQPGASFSGFYSFPGHLRLHFTGTLSGEHDIHISVDGGIELSGTAVVNDTTTTNFDRDFNPNRHLILRISGGPDDGKTFDFSFYDPF
jgi:PKD domain